MTEKSERGYKTLAVCLKLDEDMWKLVGLISILDPPRSDTALTVQRCNELGVEVKMITGDQRLIAIEVARQLKLQNLAIFEKDVFNSNSHVADQAGGFPRLCEQAGGFAGVSPEHKHRVVTALQGRGHFVGMTGDGVNDVSGIALFSRVCCEAFRFVVCNRIRSYSHSVLCCRRHLLGSCSFDRQRWNCSRRRNGRCPWCK